MTDAQISIPFSGGPKETVDPRSLPPGSVIAVQNAVYDADGEYQVRLGYTQMGTNFGSGCSLTRATVLSTFRDEVVCADGNLANQGGTNAYLWNYRASASEFRPVDTVSAVGVTHRPLQNATSDFTSYGETIAGGYRVAAWVDSVDSQPRAAIYDVSTGAIAENVRLLAMPSSHPAANIQIGAMGTAAVVVAFDTTSHAILGWTCDLTQSIPTWSASTTLSSSDYTGITSPFGVFAFCVLSSTLMAIAYETTSAGASCITVRTFNAALSQQASHQNSLGGTPPVVLGITACGTSSLLWVGISLAGSMSVMLVTPSTATASATTTAIATGGSANCPPIGCCVIDATHAFFIVAGPLGAPRTSFFTMTSGSASHVTKLYNVVPASSPAYVSSMGTTMAWLRGIANIVSGSGNTSYFLVDFQGSEIPFVSGDWQPALQAICAPRIVSASTLPTSAPTINALSSTQFETVLPMVRSGTRNGLDRFTFDTAAAFRYSPAFLGRARYLSGARYAGARVAELGFAWPPICSLANASGVGSFSDTYDVAFTWMWVDEQGNAEESDPTFVTGIVAASSAQFNYTIYSLTLTNKQRLTDATSGQGSKVFLNVYRTRGLSTGDTNLYRVTTDPIPLGAANVFSAASLTYVDTATDATIVNNAVLYTQSGELAHVAPDQLTAITTHKDRIWGIGADQRTIWYSQKYSDGSMPHWALVQQITVDDADEPLTALASLYDKLVIFSARRVWVIYGDGPAVDGSGNDLTQPQMVPSPGGCADPRSVVQTPLGVMFRSPRGFELLDQGINVTYIGQAVSTTTAAYPITTSAVYCENTSTVRFTLVTSEAFPSNLGGGDSGVILIYDIRRQRWTMHYLTQGAQGGQAATRGAIIEAATYHSTFGYVEAHNDTTSAAIVGQENTAASTKPWLDWATYFVPLYVQLAWIKNGGGDLQGWAAIRRVRLLGQWYASHGIQVTFDYDYQVANDVHSFSGTTVNTFVNGDYEQMRFRPTQGKCQAIRATVQTTDPGSIRGSGRGGGFTGIAFEIRDKRGGYRRIPVAANG